MNNKTYILCQGNKVLGAYSSLSEAESQRDREIKKDWLEILCKRKLAKALRKTEVFPSDNYFISEVVSNAVPNGNFM